MTSKNTVIENLLKSNKNWNKNYAIGYLEGAYDGFKGNVPTCDRLNTSDYGHGYWKGYSNPASWFEKLNEYYKGIKM